jgi:predicted membrane channel-forming protein YqfA (hemolysin III family)
LIRVIGYTTEIPLMVVTLKEILGLLLVITICFLALCAIFYCTQDLPPYLKDAATALITAMIGGVAAGVYLDFIGLRTQKNE